MAFPRMAKLIDLARDILPAARSDTYDPIAPAALTDIQPPTQETDAAPSAPDTGFGINVPFEGISDPLLLIDEKCRILMANKGSKNILVK